MKPRDKSLEERVEFARRQTTTDPSVASQSAALDLPSLNVRVACKRIRRVSHTSTDESPTPTDVLTAPTNVPATPTNVQSAPFDASSRLSFPSAIHPSPLPPSFSRRPENCASINDSPNLRVFSPLSSPVSSPALPPPLTSCQSFSLPHSTTRGPFRCHETFEFRRPPLCFSSSTWKSATSTSSASSTRVSMKMSRSRNVTWRSAFTLIILTLLWSVAFDVAGYFAALQRRGCAEDESSSLPLLMQSFVLLPVASAQTSSSIPTLLHSFPTLLDGLPGSQLSLNHLAVDDDTGEARRSMDKWID